MCEYCEGTGAELDVLALDTGDANYPCVSISSRGELEIITDSREYAEADDLWMVRINYCPMCGRKLAGRGSVMADVRALSKLRDQYQEKADRYYESYQMDGRASAMRAYERNEALADALTDAMAAQDTKEQLIALKAMVMELRPDDERGDLALDVRRLQKRVSEGRL